MKEITQFRGKKSKSYKYFVTVEGKVFRQSIRTGQIKEMFYHIAHGYRRVRIKDTETGVRRYYRVSRLVSEAFLTKPDGHDIVNHIDGNKQNDHVSNLEWSTIAKNTQHAYDNGLVNDRGGWKSTPYCLRTRQYRGKAQFKSCGSP